MPISLARVLYAAVHRCYWTALWVFFSLVRCSPGLPRFALFVCWGHPSSFCYSNGTPTCVNAPWLGGIASNGISKSYATNPNVVDNNSYCLLVNLFCLAVSLCVALLVKRGRVSECINEIHTIRPKQFGYIVMNTLSSNICSLLTLAILSEGDIIVLTPLNSAMAFLISQFIAVVIEKEKFAPLPVALALGATVVSIWG